MGTVREHGYREYPDDLTPGKGGESSLLFSKDGSLSAHAPFYRDRDEDGDGTSREEDSAERFVQALAVVGLAAAVYGLVRGTTRAVAAIRARRLSAAMADQSAETDVEETKIPVAATQATEPDADDELIEEVEALCKAQNSNPEEPGEPLHEALEDNSQPEKRTATARKRRLH